MKKTTLLTIIFSYIICHTFGYSETLAHTRIKRWEKGGSMNMQGNMGTSDLSNMFRGTAGVDYPDLKTIPNTNFRCEEQVYEGGLYADTETRCQVYHVCHDGRKDSFLCGRGTIFNQQILACDYWYSAECETAPNYYYVNSQIGNSVSPNNLQDNNSKYGGNHQQIIGSAGDNRRLPSTGANDYGHNQQQPAPGRTGNNRRLPNTGTSNHGYNQQQPIPGSIVGDRRMPNTGVSPDNLNMYNQQQPLGSAGDNRRLSNAGVNTNQYNGHNPGSTNDNRRIPNTGINRDPYNGHNQQCRCIRSINKTPWSFPAGMMQGNDR